MGKRIISAALCLVLLLAALPRSADAAGYWEKKRIREQIVKIHQETLEYTERETMSGVCGLQVSWAIRLLGINTYLESFDGNKQYDHYSQITTTTGGHRVKAYPAEEYSLEEALNTVTKCGTEDVYNILVCFEWTNTEAGKEYGHACMIHAILNGYVYFTEGFDTSTVPEGQPIIIPIEEFVKFFSSWTRYEGLILFGKKDPADFYEYYSTDIFVETVKATSLFQSIGGELQRQAKAGERLHATALYKDTKGQYFYLVDDDGNPGYIPATNAEPIWFNYEDVELDYFRLLDKVSTGKEYREQGRIRTVNGQLEQVKVVITDQSGKTVSQKELAKNGKYCDLNRNDTADYSALPKGQYTYNLYITARNHYLENGRVTTHSQSQLLHTQTFRVAGSGLPNYADVAGPTDPEEPQPETREVKNGWVYQDGTWYCFENDVPRTGWLCHRGLDYYLKEDGSVTTGWAEINGKIRYFSPTGAMRVGWMEMEDGVRYLLSNGVSAQGWRTIEGNRYYFAEDGTLETSQWIRLGEQLYYLMDDGKVAVGWVELDSGRYSFHADGHLVAKMENTEEGDRIVPYDGTWEPK